MAKSWSSGKGVSGFLLALTAGAICVMANAQTPQARISEPNAIYTFGKALTRSEVIVNRALDNRALNLNRTQSAEIDRFTDIYVEERRKLDEKYPVIRGEMPKPEAILARDRALVAYTTAVTKLLSPEQIKIWKDGQAARRPPRPANAPPPRNGMPVGR